MKQTVKKNFEYGQKVKVTMDGSLTGRITGVASESWFDVYIVTLDIPRAAKDGKMFSTFTMSEMYLESMT